MVTFTPKGLILPDPPTILYQNLLSDPHLLNSTWTQQGSTGTFTHPTVGGPNGSGYFEYAMATANTSSPMTVVFNVGTGTSGMPCVPGETYNLSCWAYRSIADGSQTQRFGIDWYNAAGSTISSVNTANVTTVQNDYVRVNIDVVAPAGAVFMRPKFVWSGTYPIGCILRVADAQVSPTAGVHPFTVFPVTAADGEYVQVAHLNANLDRLAKMGIGGAPLLSSERPNFGSIDDSEGTLIYETDTRSVLFRRKGNSGGAVGAGSTGANWRNVVPGAWRDWTASNIWAGWLAGDSNIRRARFMPLGRLCFVHIEAKIGTGGSITGSPGFAASALAGMLPLNLDSVSEAGFTADSLSTGPWPVGDAVANIGGSSYHGRVILSGNSIYIRSVPTTSAGTGNLWNTTVPATWAVGDGIAIDLCYTTT